MKTIDKKKLASIEFTIKWKSTHASHTDCYFARKVNFWKDMFPQEIYDMFMEKREGDKIELSHNSQNIVPFYNPDNEFYIEKGQFNRNYRLLQAIEPHFGRFYPNGILEQIPDVYRVNIKPFRCVGINDSRIRVDFNHPLTLHEFKLTASVHNVREKLRELGGTCTDWMATITDGPGMQARWQGKPTDFISDDSFGRADESDDLVFYREPRLVTHIDDNAISIISDIYGKLLKDGMRVLDLMSSLKSHIPENIKLSYLIGLGLNAEEMKHNNQLTDYMIHDLNKDCHLPFHNGEFDTVICSVSVDYMTCPFEIFEDVARILKPNGYFIVTFSNRLFPPKAVKIWTELHEFERVGLVLEYFLKSGKYEHLETFSMRGLTRPKDDKYYPQILVSDPVYAVWGSKA